MIAFGRLAAASVATFAAIGLLSAPVAAAQLPAAAAVAPAAGIDSYGQYDSHAGDVFGHGWGYNRYRRHGGDHLRTGDAIAGIAILGAVVAIASAASNQNRTSSREVYRDRPVRERDSARYGERRESRWGEGGINSAVNMCVNQVERGDDRVGSVDNASRDASGWRVDGSLDGGGAFSCRLDNEGRIRAIDIGDGYAAADAPATGDAQWSDDAYLSARASVGQQDVRQPGAVVPAAVDADLENGPKPAYPGGPLPGEEGYEDSLGG
ncbi:MAG: hypothetical protein ABIT10_11815 [Alteraurantiacibacter sp.]